MRARLNLWMDQISSGFWFLPSLMLLLASGLALLLLHVDRTVDPGIEGSIPWAYTGGAEGARSLLSTIAGSMITAATVTFSLASVALSIASQQYGSRVLRNYMRDRITQVLLGTFISTFIYSVLVVRDIRGTDEGGFVPAIAVTGAIALSLVSLILLIFFVHHISTSIKASHQLLVIAKDIRRATKHLYPASAAKSPVTSLPLPSQRYMELNSDESGYLQSVDMDTLFEVARRESLVIRLCVKPGDHHIEGSTVAQVFGVNTLSNRSRDELLDAFIFGGERTPAQDIRYQFQQLTEIVIRALSPAINDPFTAVNGIDQLTTGLSLVARQPRAGHQKLDENGDLRVVAPVPEVSEMLEQTVGHIAIYASADRFVLKRLLRLVDVVQPDLRAAPELAVAAALREHLEEKILSAASGNQINPTGPREVGR